MGTRIPMEELIEMGWYNEDHERTDNLPESIEMYYSEDDDGYIVGIPLCNSEDWGLDNKDLTEEDLETIINKAKQKLNRPIKLMMGTRPT